MLRVKNKAEVADILDTLQEGIENTYISKLQDNISLNDLKNMVNAETWMTGTDAAEKFKVEVMPPVKSLNAVGNVKKIKSNGIKNSRRSENFGRINV